MLLYEVRDGERRGYNSDSKWPIYRGKSVDPYESIKKLDLTYPIYPDHDEKYLKECLKNLRDKGVDIE
ncbi:hypothetical protein [uncultured Anaerococcus sp.]|uniref:hypothetical protein n=1 Tax=uncultured Anaerococcus sp. TaxID=293428 RepID=UPI0026242FEB|nr:hypothetical protein [uncultured Anaerococcus sp.]